MKERQANIQLLNSKLAELDVPDNALLWEKIEARLAQFPLPQTAKPALNAGVVNSVILKVILATAIGSIIAVICWIAITNKRPAPQVTAAGKTVEVIPVQSNAPHDNTLPVQQKAAQIIQPASADGNTNEPGANLSARKLTKDTLLNQPAETPVDKGIQGTIADSVKGKNVFIPLQNDTIRLGTNTANIQELYYFDVQKKKGKKH